MKYRWLFLVWLVTSFMVFFIRWYQFGFTSWETFAGFGSILISGGYAVLFYSKELQQFVDWYHSQLAEIILAARVNFMPRPNSMTEVKWNTPHSDKDYLLLSVRYHRKVDIALVQYIFGDFEYVNCYQDSTGEWVYKFQKEAPQHIHLHEVKHHD